MKQYISEDNWEEIGEEIHLVDDTLIHVVRSETNYILLNGRVEKMYPDGSLRETYTVENGIKQGPFTQYHSNRVLSNKGYYEDGLLYGAIYSYDERGEVDFVIGYEFGNPTTTLYPKLSE